MKYIIQGEGNVRGGWGYKYLDHDNNWREFWSPAKKYSTYEEALMATFKFGGKVIELDLLIKQQKKLIKM
jgi:hypothetical protein